jgi:hypothetical protein
LHFLRYSSIGVPGRGVFGADREPARRGVDGGVRGAARRAEPLRLVADFFFAITRPPLGRSPPRGSVMDATPGGDPIVCRRAQEKPPAIAGGILWSFLMSVQGTDPKEGWCHDPLTGRCRGTRRPSADARGRRCRRRCAARSCTSCGRRGCGRRRPACAC